MELYQLRVRTLQILDSLRKSGTGGPAGAGRGVGKTTALLLRAKELLDDRGGMGHVFILTAFTKTNLGFLELQWDQMFGSHIGVSVRFIGHTGHIRGYRNAHVLIDEPYLLKKTADEWKSFYQECARQNIKIESVGRWDWQ
jgi:hypothetical protein